MIMAQTSLGMMQVPTTMLQTPIALMQNRSRGSIGARSNVGESPRHSVQLVMVGMGGLPVVQMSPRMSQQQFVIGQPIAGQQPSTSARPSMS